MLYRNYFSYYLVIKITMNRHLWFRLPSMKIKTNRKNDANIIYASIKRIAIIQFQNHPQRNTKRKFNDFVSVR